MEVKLISYFKVFFKLELTSLRHTLVEIGIFAVGMRDVLLYIAVNSVVVSVMKLGIFSSDCV